MSTTKEETKVTTPTFEQYMTSLKTDAKDQYDQAVTDAELNRQREVLAAGNAYRSALANSGANAQALSSMGLTGSGYSAYLDSQAYAQKQGAINTAFQNKQSAIERAQSAKNSAYVTADGLYADYLANKEKNKEKEKQTNYTNLLNSIDKYTISDISTLGTQYGLTEDQINGLVDIKSNQVYTSLLGTDYTKTQLDDLLSSGQISKPNYDKLVSGFDKITADEITFVKSDGTPMTKTEAQAELDKIKSTGFADKQVIEDLQNKLNTKYSIKTAGVDFKKDSGLKGMFSNQTGTAGNNIKLEDEAGNVYKVQYSGDELNDSAILESIDIGTVFKYNNVLYVKGSDNKAYAIEAKPTNQSSFKDLLDKFDD